MQALEELHKRLGELGGARGEPVGAKVARLKRALGDHLAVKVGYKESEPNAEPWRTMEVDGKQAEVNTVFLQCRKQPYGSMPRWAREANGVLLKLGEGEGEGEGVWEYAAIPPPAVKYITNAEELPAREKITGIYRAEDGTRVTATREEEGGRLLYTTTGSSDAGGLQWFESRTLKEVCEEHIGAEALKNLPAGRSHTFIVHDAMFQPFEQESKGAWFVSAVDLRTREVSYEAPAGSAGRRQLNVPPEAICEMAQQKMPPTARPFYGIVAETQEGPCFAESGLYKDLRRTLYEREVMDREVGPADRLRMRALRAFLNGGAKKEAFRKYFPTIADEIYEQAHELVVATAEAFRRITEEMYRVAPKEKLGAALERITGRRPSKATLAKARELARYMHKGITNALVISTHPNNDRGFDNAREYIQQPAHLDALTRTLFAGVKPIEAVRN